VINDVQGLGRCMHQDNDSNEHSRIVQRRVKQTSSRVTATSKRLPKTAKKQQKLKKQFFMPFLDAWHTHTHTNTLVQGGWLARRDFVVDLGLCESLSSALRITLTWVAKSWRDFLHYDFYQRYFPFQAVWAGPTLLHLLRYSFARRCEVRSTRI